MILGAKKAKGLQTEEHPRNHWGMGSAHHKIGWKDTYVEEAKMKQIKSSQMGLK